jgi:hypothetical protein
MKGQDERIAAAFRELLREGIIESPYQAAPHPEARLAEIFKQTVARLGGGCFSIKGARP